MCTQTLWSGEDSQAAVVFRCSKPGGRGLLRHRRRRLWRVRQETLPARTLQVRNIEITSLTTVLIIWMQQLIYTKLLKFVAAPICVVPSAATLPAVQRLYRCTSVCSMGRRSPSSTSAPLSFPTKTCTVAAASSPDRATKWVRSSCCAWRKM